MYQRNTSTCVATASTDTGSKGLPTHQAARTGQTDCSSGHKHNNPRARAPNYVLENRIYLLSKQPPMYSTKTSTYDRQRNFQIIFLAATLEASIPQRAFLWDMLKPHLDRTCMLQGFFVSAGHRIDATCRPRAGAATSLAAISPGLGRIQDLHLSVVNFSVVNFYACFVWGSSSRPRRWPRTPAR